MQINEWYEYAAEHDSFYGSEQKRCYRMALFSGDTMVGKEVPYDSYQSKGSGYNRVQPWAKFGLTLKVKKIKEFVPRKKTAAEKPVQEVVTIQRFDREGRELLSMVKESRSVYTNTKGRYIKTRSEGVVHLTIDKPATVQFHGRKVVKHG